MDDRRAALRVGRICCASGHQGWRLGGRSRSGLSVWNWMWRSRN